MGLQELLGKVVENGAADLFIVAGQPATMKIYGKLETISEERLLPDTTYSLVEEIYRMANNRRMNKLLEQGDDDFSFSVPGLSRFRVSAYKQRGSFAAVIRVISFQLPAPEEIGVPQEVVQFADINKGLVLVTGPAGMGKSTTQACMIDYINKTRTKHIITLEDPIEYLHSHKSSIVSQREITIDSVSYVNALRAALRQAPDVVLLGEMRDYETINIALTAAETGHTVISTLHTLGAATTIDRIIDVFPANQQRQVALQLSMTLETVISQQLVPALDGRLVPAFEIMRVNPAVRNLIRENKIYQIDNIISSGTGEGMLSMENSLLSLYKAGKITAETALLHSMNREVMKRKLGAR